MMDVGRHPRIELLTLAEVKDVSGYVGNFTVKINNKARFVREKDCNACADCVKVCPVVRPDAFQVGLGSRRAIYIPFPQAVPFSYLIDMDACLGTNPIACGKCAEACERGCIDYDMKDELIERKVGAVVVATGMAPYDPTEYDEYGYTRYENVITSLEFERLIDAGGPTDGHFCRPSDRKEPLRIGFVQCVGSRSQDRGNPYCSNICCMNTVKDTLLLREHIPESDIKVFYMDIRAFGKGFEDLYRRSREEGVRYIRGLPGEVLEDPATKNLWVKAEDTSSGRLEEHEFDLIVLSIGLMPAKNELIRELLTLSKTSDGFFLESHPKLKPVDAPTRGVFLAGCAESPKDIKDSVTQAGAAAARAGILLHAGEIAIEAITSELVAEKCKFCELCVNVCPYSAISGVDKKAKTLPVIVEAACAGCGTCGAECQFGAIQMKHFTDDQLFAQIDALLEIHPEEKVLTFACNWCSYAGADFAGVSRLAYPPSVRLVRTMCSGRVSENMVLRAFAQGAAMVAVSGCHFADCHYINANRQTVRRVERLWDRLERYKVRPERLQLEWISAAEGQKFQRVMKELEAMRKRVTREEIKATMDTLEKRYGGKTRAKATNDASVHAMRV
jgi:heterodisulfide reductase subunit A